MTHDELSAVTWRKSSYSGDNGGNCIEVGEGLPSLMPVRDSKDPEGPALVFSTDAWFGGDADIRPGLRAKGRCMG